MPSPSLPAHLQTRQQLDELDALLKRMLDLPSSEPAEPAPPQEVEPAGVTFPAPLGSFMQPPGSAWQMEFPQPTSFTPAFVPAAVPEVPWAVAVEETAEPVPHTFHAPQFAAGHALPAGIPEAKEVALDTRAIFTPIQYETPAILWPLVIFDNIYVFSCRCFGPLTSWLGDSSGKHLLGWAGILLILTAAVWGVGDWAGWLDPMPGR